MEFLALIIVIFVISILMKNIFIKMGLVVASSNKKTMNFFNPLGHLFKFLINGVKSDGMMSSYKQDKIFSSRNKGLLLDGKEKRLSLEDSLKHLALISPTGGGKTSSYIIPNIFKLASEKNSMVITDISGELFNKTSGYLQKKGYKVYVLNPDDLTESIGYNPLYNIKDSVDIDEIANILIKSNKEIDSTSADSQYWESGGKSLITMMIKLLLLKNNPKHLNLANVRYLINNFGTDGENIKHLFDECDDVKLQDEFRAICKVNPMTLTSFVANANISLNPIGINDNLEKLTSNHTIDFEKFRKEKSVIYIKIAEKKQEQYRFLLNIFYKQFFNQMMDKLPSENDLPIFTLLDEFGNMNLPSFDTTITTIRKYKVSISIILQDINQLEAKYGEIKAKTIINGGITSKLYYSGAGLPTTQELSKMLGTIENIKTDIDGNFYLKEEPVMKAHEIRIMDSDEAIFITSNQLPAKYKVKPYYKDFIFSQYSQMPPFKIEAIGHLDDIDFIDIYPNYEE